jgi:hypothetical protein
MTRRAILRPEIVTAARRIVNDCPSRDDDCELNAVYEAVKSGTVKVKGLGKGFRYVLDPLPADWFQSPQRSLQSCLSGACGGDCDEHASLVAALVGALGYRVGLRAYGPAGGKDFTHVYACVAYPKTRPPKDPREWVGMDTTVDEAFVGWDPPRGRFLTAQVV